MPVDPKLTEIAKRWSRVPRLRIAQGIDDAANDWPIGSFGEDEDTGKECWIATDHVHASEMVMSCTEIAEVLAKAPGDMDVLFKAISVLYGQRDEAVRLLRQVTQPRDDVADLLAHIDRLDGRVTPDDREQEGKVT